MKYLYQNKHWEINKDYNLDVLLYSMIDRPNEISSFNEMIWRNSKYETHRDYDLPSYIYIFIDEMRFNLYWYKNSKNHREKSKPAIIEYNGDEQYCTNGKFIKTEQSK